MDSLLYSYDRAIKTVLYDKFAPILGIDAQSSSEAININLGIFQIPKEAAQRTAAEKRGQTYLEFISFWRTGAAFSWKRNRTPVSRRGIWVATSADGADTVQVKGVPIDLTYDVWFWSKNIDKIYQVIEKYIFWQQDNPNISIEYNDAYELTPDLHFGEIVDESTVGEQFTAGITYVYRMPIRLDAWVLESGSSKVIYKIRFTVRDKDELTNYEEIFLEDSNQDTEMEAALRFSREAIYNISEVNLSSNSIGILGSFASDFVEGQKIKIVDSTDNDNVYTITSKSYMGETDITTVVVVEALVSATGDGTISLKTV